MSVVGYYAPDLEVGVQQKQKQKQKQVSKSKVGGMSKSKTD